MNKIIQWVLLAPLLLVSFTWACAALFFDGPYSGLIAAAFACAAVGVFGWVRPLRKSLLVFGALFIAVVFWWLSIQPSNEREWLPDVARLPRADIDGDLVTIRNVRNFIYRSEFDYDERWEERTFDLAKLEGVDVFLVYWGSPWIAHTIMSWVFEDGPPLAISIETRKEVGEEYSAVRGFFRQFEIYYVVSDELDVVRLRTNYRGEEVYLYRLLASPELARTVLHAYFGEINQLAMEPRWYNAIRYNCTTAIRHLVQSVAPGSPFDWRILLNGRIDELAYQRGNIDTSMPFDELRQKSEITQRAKAVKRESEFSARIRDGLPVRKIPMPRADSVSAEPRES